jgi:F420-dependent oxidoreductase-like protein
MTAVTRLGLQIPSFTYPGVADRDLFEAIAAIAVTAEESGFDSVWVMDHFYQIVMVGPATDPMLEAYTLLGSLAARTSSVSLGAMVTGVTYRNPALLAKTVTTLDIVSGGRAILGIGAAWNDQEHAGYGFDYPPIGERMDRLEEALQIARAMFAGERPTFAGAHYQTIDALNLPGPIRGRIPILVGGSGERRTLALVARYADACNLFGDLATIRHKLEVLDRHCEAIGRDPATITKTRLGTLVIAPTEELATARGREMAASRGIDEERYQATVTAGGPESVAEQARAFLDAGLDGLIFNMPDAHEFEPVRLAGTTLAPVFA